jgi:hypothetical protein
MVRSNQIRFAFICAFILSALVFVCQTVSAQTCAPAPAGLVDFWPGDRSANDFVGANHGTLTNGATYTDSGKVGAAFIFDGADDFVDITSTINLGSTFSVELWIYPTSSGSLQHLVATNPSGGTNYGSLYFSTDHIEYRQGGAQRAVTPATSVPLNAWTHVALTYNGSVAQLYLNGTASGSASAVHAETFNNPLRFGYSSIPQSQFFQGRLDEISLYNAALSAAEVLSIFNGGDKGKCVAPALLVSDGSTLEGNGGTTNLNFTVNLLRASVAAQVDYATVDGTAIAPGDYTATNGTTAVPASGSAAVTVLVNGDTSLEQNETFLLNLSNPVNATIIDGQAVGTIFSDDCTAPLSGLADWYQAEGNALDSIGTNHGTLVNGATFAVGSTGQAFSLDGTDDFVDVASTVNLGSAYTVELWIHPTSTGFQNLVSNNQSGANFGNLYYSGTSTNLQYVQAGGLKANSLSGSVPLNAWTHAALTYDGAVTRLYVNGVASGAPSGIHTETFNNPLRFGYSIDGAGVRFQGRLDEISLYNRALSAAEIQAVFAAGGGGKCASGVNNWTGAVSSDWHTAGNWSGGVVPASGADVAIPAVGVTNEPTITSADVTVNSLNIAAARTLTVASGRTLTVNNDLINGGTLTGAGTIAELGAVNNSGTISVGSFNFNRAGAQSLLGAGSFSNNIATVVNGSTLTLLSNHQFRSLTIQTGATLDISSRTMSVSGNLTNSGGTFTVTGSTVVANGVAAQTLTGANFFSLTANNPAASLGSNTTVSNLLTLTSDLTTGAFVLTMPFATQDTAGGGDLIGNFRLTNPAGPLSKYGNPFTKIGVSGGTPPTDITVNLVKSAPVGFPTAVQRTYSITPNGGGGFTATVQLHYLDAELTNGNVEGAALSLWRFNGTAWQKQPTNAFSITDNWVQTTNVTQFSPWTFNSTVPTAAPATISGQITSADGAPLGGVLLTLTGGDGQRRTITNGEGFYQFTDMRTDAFYSLSPMRANYAFAPAERSFSLLANKTDAVFTAHALPETANALDTPEFFIRQHYLDFLNREPDSRGLDFWANEIISCGTNQHCIELKRINVSAAFYLSIEFQETGYLVERLYKSAYGDADATSVIGGSHQIRVPIVRLNEFLADTQQIGKGVRVGLGNWQTQLENNKVAFTQEFVSRSRFLNAYPTTMTAADFVDALFLKAVVTPSAAERTSIINEFGGAEISADTAARARALQRVAENTALAQQETNKAFVLMQYFSYLRRNPNETPDADHSGYDFWLTKLNEFNGNFVSAEMVKAFIVSGEYRRRFGP